MQENFQDFEIILVNDSGHSLGQSNQDTLKKYGISNLTILNLAYFHDRENAMTAGTDLSTGDFVFEFDYPIENICDDALIDLYNLSADKGADIAAFYNQEQERKTSRLFYKFLNWFGLTETVVHTEVIRIISRRALNKTLKERRRFRFRKLLYRQTGFNIALASNNKIQYFDDISNGSRMQLGIDILIGAANIGSRVSKYLSLGCIAISTIISAYALFVYLFGLDVSAGWTTLMLFLAFGFSSIFMILFMISRTLEMIFDELIQPTPYKIKDIAKVL
ncbi:hypothetical protein OAN90_00865 [Gammaproteobacteria bacterium]|nr:hypothetical protein [Gammaproteobacteria bacterium]